MTKPTDSDRILLKPATLLAPVPAVLVSCAGLPGDGQAKNNLLTIAWAGTICSNPPMVSISVQPVRYSHQLIKESGEFVINLVDKALLPATDYCGVRSGRDEDKFKSCKLTPIPAEGLQYAPAVAQSPLYLSCQVKEVLHLGSHDCFLAEIAAVSARADLMDENGRLCLDKAGLVSYVHGEYFALGSVLGFFGYSVASEQVLKRRLPDR